LTLKLKIATKVQIKIIYTVSKMLISKKIENNYNIPLTLKEEFLSFLVYLSLF
jgi:hypothetical protein